MQHPSQISNATSASASSSRTVNNSRPNKRFRGTDSASSEEESSAGRRVPGQARPRTRATVACFVCRERKTRCDGARPVCSYCARTGSACRYDTVDASTDQTSCLEMGSQILRAIEQLTNLVKEPPRPSSRGHGNSFQASLPMSSPEAASSSKSDDHSGRFSEGLDSLFGWRVFHPGLDAVQVDDGRPVPMPEELPPITLSDLTRLQMNYRRVVHTVNPMLDLSTMDRYVTHISENGFDWTTRTCLVALVCAIGAICQNTSIDTPNSVDRNDDLEVAYRFWSVACKRLGRAMSHNTVEAAQCLCLAGIWFMCNLQPLNAWKHFTMAGNCCYSTIVARNCMSAAESHSVLPQAIEQSIFYTAYKSELEIRYELSIPGSVLEHIEDQLVFPSPPPLNNAQLERPAEETISWYYYLADIAARHLINRIMNSGVKVKGCPNEAQTKALLHDYRIFWSQLDDWYHSLPSEISFPLPTSRVGPEVDPPKRILRSRFLSIRELLCRPFVRICLNYTLNLPQELIDEMASTASLGLQYAAWRLQAVGSMNRLDHGLWIWVRNNTACSMILIGAARSNRIPSLNAAARMWLPDDWHDDILSFLKGLEMYSNETRGGVMDCYRLICSSLEEFQSGASIQP